MRIVHINYVFESGLSPDATVERYRTLRRVAEAQATQGNEVYVCTRHSAHAEFERGGVRYVFRDDNTKSPQAQPWTYPKDLHHLAGLLNPDAAHVHSLKFYPQVRMLRAELGPDAPIVVQHHAERPAPAPISYLQRGCLETADGYIFNGKVNAEEWLNAGAITRWDDVYESPEGSADFVPVPRELALRATGIRGKPAVLWVGRMHEAKDPLTVLEGFRLYAREHPDAHLYMIFRDGPLGKEIAGRIADAPLLEHAVTLLGERPYGELPSFYSAADIFLTAAPYEGSNYALIEALSCGIFAACSSIGPHKYLTDNGKYAEYFAPGDAAACAVALETAAARSRDGLREKTVQYFKRELSFEAIARKLGEIYEAVGS